MSRSFDDFLQQIFSNESAIDSPIEDSNLYFSSQRELSKEFRKVLDKIAVEFLYDRFESDDLIKAVLELTRSERIIIVFHIILGMTSEEVAFLLDKNMNTIYAQKSMAIKKLKDYIIENNLF